MEFRDIKNWPGYVISRDGQIIGKYKKKLKPELIYGYERVVLCRNKYKQHKFVHQLVLETYDGERPSDRHVSRHLNGNKLDNRIENLRWGTQVENCADRARHGRNNEGERHHLSKLKVEDVKKIKSLLDSGHTCEEIAEMFNVVNGTIWFIKNGRTWKHVH